MKTDRNKRKTVCKNTNFSVISNYIRLKRGKKLFIIAFWSRFVGRYYGKESSHVAGINTKLEEVVENAILPPRQSREQASYNSFSGW